MRTSAVLVLSLLALAISTAAPPQAQARQPVARTWHGRPAPLVTMSLVDHEGMALRSVMHRGQTFVAGDRGERYAIALTNNTSNRVEVVVTVDGRDVVSGKRGDFRTQRGYVLAPFQTIEIDGFRQSLSRVAAFRFTDVAGSYAARRGDARDAGAVRVAVFKEKRQPIAMKRARDTESSAAPSASRRAAPRTEQQLGTEYGESRDSMVKRVTFERMSAKQPDFRTALFYDSPHGLADRGIPVEPEPRAIDDDAFAPPP
jgi:hypothetical protein